MTFRAAVRAGASALALAISPLGLAPAAPARATTVPLSDCANPDNGDPRILGLTLGQSALDVRTSPAVLGVSVTAVDTGGPGPSSGVDGVTVWFHGPGESRPDYPAPMTRDPGGTWRVGVTFPPGVAPGVWRPRVSVQDAAGLVRTYDGDALAALGLPSQLVVTSTPDTAAPRLIRLTLSRHSVDTRLRRENVTVTARTTEDPAGIRVVAVDAFGPTRSQHLELRRVSLAGTEVVWRGVLTFPRWSGTGLSRLRARVDGSWSCLDADAQDVDCTAGPVRGATFTPTAGLGGSPAYGIVLNPEGSLDVRDLAGNPFRRYGVGPLG